jgi:hypothetical protein
MGGAVAVEDVGEAAVVVEETGEEGMAAAIC